MDCINPWGHKESDMTKWLSLASVWDKCNCVMVWTFFGIAFLWYWNENWPFPVLWPLLSFPDLLAFQLRWSLNADSCPQRAVCSDETGSNAPCIRPKAVNMQPLKSGGNYTWDSGGWLYNTTTPWPLFWVYADFHPATGEIPPAGGFVSNLNFTTSTQVCSFTWISISVDCQYPLSMDFSRQEYGVRQPFPSPGDLRNPGIKPGSLHCRWTPYHLSHQGNACLWYL